MKYMYGNMDMKAIGSHIRHKAVATLNVSEQFVYYV